MPRRTASCSCLMWTPSSRSVPYTSIMGLSRIPSGIFLYTGRLSIPKNCWRSTPNSQPLGRGWQVHYQSKLQEKTAKFKLWTKNLTNLLLKHRQVGKFWELENLILAVIINKIVIFQTINLPHSIRMKSLFNYAILPNQSVDLRMTACFYHGCSGHEKLHTHSSVGDCW